MERTVHGAVIRVDDVMLGVRGIDHGPSAAEGQPITGAFATSEGSCHLVVLAATEREPLRMLTPEIVDRGIDRTIADWRAWSTEFSWEGDWSEAVLRSALALKLLIYSPTGSIAVDATTSIPESRAGGKNWD